MTFQHKPYEESREVRQKEAYRRYYRGEKPSFSTGICESITAGYGELGFCGYWEFPLLVNQVTTDVLPICPKYLSHMVRGQAINPHMEDTCLYVMAPAVVNAQTLEMIDCLKCPACGHSETGKDRHGNKI